MQLYRFILFAPDSTRWDEISLPARADVDAVLFGNTLERDHPRCTGVQIWRNGRLVYAHQAATKSGPREPWIPTSSESISKKQPPMLRRVNG